MLNSGLGLHAFVALARYWGVRHRTGRIARFAARTGNSLLSHLKFSLGQKAQRRENVR